MHPNHPTAVPSRTETCAATRMQAPQHHHWAAAKPKTFLWFLAKPPGQLCTDNLKTQPYLLYIRTSLFIDFTLKFEAFVVDEALTWKA